MTRQLWDSDFNPMWSYPSTSVNHNYENITFGMHASHLKENPDHAKDALISQSPIVVFDDSYRSSKSWCHRKSNPSRKTSKILPNHVVTTPMSMSQQHPTAINFERKEPILF